MDTLTFHNAEFTFEQVDGITDLPRIYVHISAKTHEEALERYHTTYRALPPAHVHYWTPKKPIGKYIMNTYAFGRAEDDRTS